MFESELSGGMEGLGLGCSSQRDCRDGEQCVKNYMGPGGYCTATGNHCISGRDCKFVLELIISCLYSS